MGPLLGKVTIPTCPHSCLSKGTFQTNKHNDFKEIRGTESPEIVIENTKQKT